MEILRKRVIENNDRGSLTSSVLARDNCKERCFLRDQSIAVV